jgi:hypothetical protein
LREKVGAEGARMRGVSAALETRGADIDLFYQGAPSSPLIRHASHDTFSLKGRRTIRL